MKETFLEYIIRLYQNVPAIVYVGLAIVLLIGVILVFVLYGKNQGLRYSCRILSVDYLALLFCSTVFFRKYSDRRGYDFQPFWSYDQNDLLYENIMNVVAFVPLGLLLGCAFKSMTWWKVMVIGMCVSLIIETMQFMYKRGFAETDDVMHNTIGCLIGFGIYSLARYGYERIGKRSVVVPENCKLE